MENQSARRRESDGTCRHPIRHRVFPVKPECLGLRWAGVDESNATGKGSREAHSYPASGPSGRPIAGVATRPQGSPFPA